MQLINPWLTNATFPDH